MRLDTFTPANPSRAKQYASLLRLLALILISVFVAEASVMLLFIILPPLSPLLQAFLDAWLLVVLVFPALYHYLLRPLSSEIEERRRAEAALQQARDELEVRVQERTEELTIANSELQAEIEERQRVGARLRESEQKYSSLFDKSPFALALARMPDGTLVSANAAFLNLFEYTWEEVSGKTGVDLEIADADSRARVATELQARGSVQDFEVTLTTRSGARYILSLNLDWISIGGEPHILTTIQDITERKRAAETMAWLASFPQFNPNPVIEVDLLGQIEYLNPIAQRLLPDIAALGLPHPWLAELESIGKQFQINSASVVTREVTIGETIYQQTLHFVPNYQRIRIYALDITERKRMEVALRRTHDELELRVQERTAALAQLSSAVEQTADTVMITNRNGAIEYVNPAFERVTGYTRAEALGQTPRLIKSGLYDQQFYAEMWQTILSGQAYFGELTNRKKNGELCHEAKTITPIRDAQGNITHFVATGKDITERKRSEEALKKLNRALRMLSECSVAQVHAEDEQSLLDEICHLIVTTGGYRMAWVGLAEQDEAKSVCPVARSGFDEDYIDNLRITWADTERGRGPTGTVIRTGIRQVNQNFLDNPRMAPWREAAAQRGYQSSIALPLKDDRVTFGALTIYSMTPDAFDSEEADLLTKLADDLALGITALRARTERKRAEQALQQSEKKFRALFETAPVGISVLDQNNHITDANQALKRIVRIPGEGLMAGVYRQRRYIRGDGTPLLPGEFASARAIAESRPVQDVEVGIVTEDDQMIWTLVSAAPLGLPDASAVVITQDITERKQAEEQIKLQIAAMEAAANGIVITDRAGCIQWTNPAFTRMTGYAPREAFGQHTRLFKSGRHDQSYYQQLWETILAGQMWHGETINRRKDGRLYIEDQTIAPVRDAQENITHFVSIKQDVTEHKRAEEEIERRNRELAALNTISAAVSRSLELSEMLLTLTRLLPEDLGIPSGAIFLYDESTDQLQFETDWGTLSAPQDARFSAAIPANAFHSPRVIREKEPLLTHDVRHAVESVAAKLHLSRPDWQDYLCVPLVAQDRLQGVLDLFSRAPAQFAADDVDFFKSLGQEVGIAIQNARLYQAEQQARQTAETLRAASLALTQTLDLEAVVNTLLDYVEQLIPYDAANVMLLETKERLTIRAARDYEQWEDGNQVYHRTCDVSSIPSIQQLFEERRGLIIADGLAQPDRTQGLHLAQARSWLGVPLIAGGNVIGLYALIKVEPHYFTLHHMQLAEALVGQAAVAVQNAWLFEQVRQGREQLQDLSRRLVEIQESERRYIARELHDEAGQALTSLMVGLRLLERDAGRPEALKLGIAELNRLVDGVQENLHRLAVDLRPASLDYLGLVAALRQYVENLSDKHGLVVQFEAVGLGHERLPSEVETAVYRIVQEALTNVVRHAHATRVDVLLERRSDRLAAIVEDNGIGFDVAQPQSGRLGLFGIRERAEMLGGTLLIESSEHSGTTLVVEVPCAS